MEQINKVFNNLNNFRKFSDYQLERRADIYFQIYLEEVLWKKYKKKFNSQINFFRGSKKL